MINIFDYSIHSDWQLASLVCKALWNYCDNNYEQTTNESLWFNEEQLKILFSLFDETLRKTKRFVIFAKIFDLNKILDESNLELSDDEQLNELNKQFWLEEYFPVASRLYQRLVEGNQHFKAIDLRK